MTARACPSDPTAEGAADAAERPSDPAVVSSSDPAAECSGRLPRRPPCPFCEGEETELANAFGPHASVASYWCRRCRSPFEFMRWTPRSPEEGEAEDAEAAGEGEEPEKTG